MTWLWALLACLVVASASATDSLQDTARLDTSEPGIDKYLHAPSPGPVVDKKYRPYIPESYRDYIPTMDESGVQYQKYMQGEPDAEKFQDKVLPQGSYRQNIPLSNGAEKDRSPEMMAEAADEALHDPAPVLLAADTRAPEADAAAHYALWIYPCLAAAALLSALHLAIGLRRRTTTRQHGGLSESLIV